MSRSVMIVSILTLYSAILIALSYRTRRRNGVSGYFDGGREFSAATIFVMVTALWTSSTIALEIDTGYVSGWTAVWLGVSTALLSILVSLLAPYLRRLNYTTNSDLLGQAFGALPRRLSGIIIAMTFPIFAMSNMLFAAYFLRALLGTPLWMTLAVTTAVLVAVVQFAGLRSLAAVQGMNLLLIFVGLGIMVSLVGGLPPITLHPVAHFTPVPPSLILVWLTMNLLNVFSAQAEYQAVVSARNVARARWAVLLSALLLGGVVVAATWVGEIIRQFVGSLPGGGLAAISRLVMVHATPLQTLGMALGVWALALTWCGPLLFSGAVSLGRDVIGHQVLSARFALVIEGALLVGLALLRPGELAWWSVFGLTLRNAGVVGPTVACLIWRGKLSGRWVTAAIGGGIVSGLGLNALTGFSATNFPWQINPMWIAQTVALLILAAGRWWYSRRWVASGTWAMLSAAMASTVMLTSWIPGSVRGLLLLMVAVCAFVVTHFFSEIPRPATAGNGEAGPEVLPARPCFTPVVPSGLFADGLGCSRGESLPGSNLINS